MVNEECLRPRAGTGQEGGGGVNRGLNPDFEKEFLVWVLVKMFARENPIR